MPYVNTGCIVMFDDSMTELEICQCETTKGAENIAAALNDAVRFRKLATHMQENRDGFVMRGPTDRTADVFYVGTYKSSKYGKGETVAEAIDNLDA